MCVKRALEWHRARPRLAIGVHIAITVFLLGFALVSQYAFNFHPCELCLWQRVPYAVICALALAGLFPDRKWTPVILGAIALLYFVESGIAFYHIGVQSGWWVSGCGFKAKAGDIKDLYEQIKNAPVARCNEISWTFLGFSMAAWNFAIALGLTAFTVLQTAVQQVWWTDKPQG